MSCVPTDRDRRGERRATMERPELDSEDCGDVRLEQLMDNNSALIRENNILRAQVDQAITITDKLSELHEANNALNTKLREAVAEKEDALRRLDIALKSNQKNSALIQEEKAAAANYTNQIIEQMKSEFSGAQKKYESEIESLYGQLSSVHDSHTKLEQENKQIYVRLDRMLVSASKYFGRNVLNVDDLIDIFSHPPVPTKSECRTPPKTPVISEDASMIAALQKKNKSLKKKITQLTAEIESIKNKADELKVTSSRQIETLNAQISSIKESNAAKIKDMEHSAKMMQQKIETLQSTAQNVPTVVQPVAPQPVTVPQQFTTPSVQQQPIKQVPVTKLESPKTREADIAQEQMMNRISELERQLQSVVQRRNELASRLEESVDRVERSDVELEKRKAELDSLRLVHEETLRELEAIRKALHAKQSFDQGQRKSKKCEIRQLQATIQGLERTVEVQKSQIYDLQTEKEKLVSTVDDVNRKLKLSTAKLNSAQQRSDQLTEEISELHRLNNSKTTLTEADLLPRSAWRCPEFDSSLNSVLDKLSLTDTLQPSSKLQKAFREIAKFYQRQIELREAELNTTNTEYQNLRESFNMFVSDTSLTLMDEVVNIEMFLSDRSAGQAIIDNLASLRRKAGELEYTVNTYNNAHIKFSTLFEHAKTDDFSTDIEEVHAQVTGKIDKLSNSCRRLTDKKRDLKQQLKNQTSRADRLDLENKRIKEDLTRVSEELSNETTLRASLKNELQASKHREIELNEQIAQLNKEYSENISRAKQEGARRVHEVESNLNANIDNLKAALETTQENVSDLESQVTRLKKAIHVQKTSLREKEDELAATRDEAAMNEQALIQRFDLDKSNLIHEYEEAISSISAQCDAHRIDLEKLSAELSAAKRKAEEAREVALSTKREKSKLEKDLKTLTEQLERQKKLTESNLKVQSLAAEASAEAKLGELKAKFEAERRRMFAIAADEFRQFFNPANPIDENSFVAVLAQAREELARLTRVDQSVRRLVGAAPRQATDDAVAQLVLYN